MKFLVTFYSLNDEDYNTDRTREFGPYDRLQMTYEILRDDTGRTIAAFDIVAGDWLMVDNPEPEHYSDFDITPVQP